MKNRKDWIARSLERELSGVRVDELLRARILAEADARRHAARRRRTVSLAAVAAVLAVMIGVGLLVRAPERAAQRDPVLSVGELRWVWVVEGDACYHARASCGGMEDAQRVSLEQAQAQGRRPCGECIVLQGQPTASPSSAGERGESVDDYSPQASAPTAMPEAAAAERSPESAQPTVPPLADRQTTAVAPTPAATVAPTPAATVAPTPAATVAPTPAATVAPTPAATVAPTPAMTEAPPETEKYFDGMAAGNASGEQFDATAISGVSAEPFDRAAETREALAEQHAAEVSAAVDEPAALVDEADGGVSVAARMLDDFLNKGSMMVDVGGGLFHVDSACPSGEMEAGMLFEEAVQQGFQPCPSCSADLCVWATKGGRWFHTARNCSGMENARLYTLDEAIRQGKEICPTCVGCDVVWLTEGGECVHAARNCSGMYGALEVSMLDSRAQERPLCPLCCGAACVWTSDFDPYMHSDPNCDALDLQVAVEISEYEAVNILGKPPCPHCKYRTDRMEAQEAAAVSEEPSDGSALAECE